MSLNIEHIHALILAGGQSTRLNGVDKGLIEWQNKPLTAHVIERLAGQVNSFTISCNRNLSSYIALANNYENSFHSTLWPTCIKDTRLPAQSGPLSGIYELLCHFNKKNTQHTTVNTKIPSHLMICCCDTPDLPLNIVDQLKQHLINTNVEAVYPVINGSHAYLTSLVHIPSAYAALETLISRAKEPHLFSVKNWLFGMETMSCSIEQHTQLSNINSEDDLERLRQS